jgi:hypothetical protein
MIYILINHPANIGISIKKPGLARFFIFATKASRNSTYPSAPIFLIYYFQYI